MSQVLKLKDVRAIFRLVSDVRELGADPGKWRPHMIKELVRIMEAELVVSSEIHCRATKTEGMIEITDLGWGCDTDGNVWQIHTQRETADAEAMWLSVLPSKTEQIPLQPKRSIYGGRNFILSQIALPHLGTVDQLGLHHAWGNKPFGESAHKLIRILHSELGRLWKRDAIRRAQDPNSDLPPRLHQTLEALANGASEKEVSIQLGISRHTVHNYVKALHERLGVSSRGELLAKVRKSSEFVPKFSVDT
jgi:DNA-binding CsgD family transcriptional regulator